MVGKNSELMSKLQAIFALCETERIFGKLEFDASLLESSLAFDEFSPAFEQFKTEDSNHNFDKTNVELMGWDCGTSLHVTASKAIRRRYN